MRSTLLVLAALLAGCDSTPAAPASSVAPSTSTPSTSASGATTKKQDGAALCDKAGALSKRLADVDTKASRVGVSSALALPESKEGVAVPVSAPIVEITRKDIAVGGKTAHQPSDVKGMLTGRTVLLALPKGDDGIAALPEVVRSIGGDAEVYVLAIIAGTRREPWPKGIEAKDASTSERASALAQALGKSISDCSQAKKIFQQLAADDPAGRAEFIKTQMPKAFDACSCKVGDDAVDIVAYLLAGDAPVRGKRLVVSKDASAKAIALSGLDGQKLYDALPADGSPVRFEK